MESELRGTLAIVNGQIQAELSGASPKAIPVLSNIFIYSADDHRVIIDLSDWDCMSDEGEDGHEGASVANVADGE